MPASFDILQLLEEDSSSTLHLVRYKKSRKDGCIRRFKTQKTEEISGLNQLFTQLAAVSSEHLPEIVEIGSDANGFFVVFGGKHEGETLEKIIERGPLTAEEFEVLAVQLLETLDALHEQALVHGSLRPDYIRIIGGKSKHWKIILEGFGQGFATRGETKDAQVRAYRCTAPEQWEDGTTRRRTDVYALGCVLYEALAARPPFDGKALKELRLKHLGHDLHPLPKLAPHVPSWMCAWVMHLLAADPEQRPRKAGAARTLFERREAPNLPEVPPVERPAEPAPVAKTAPAPRTGPQTLAASPPLSASVPLPISTPSVLHATSSTIPIATGPHVTQGVRGKARTTEVKRRTFSPQRKPSPASPGFKIKPPMIVAGSAILLMLVVFIIPHCRGSLNAPPPPLARPATNPAQKPGTKTAPKPKSKQPPQNGPKKNSKTSAKK